jgi:hypothetical protein
MNITIGGTIVRIIAALLLVAVLIGIGAAVYNAGVSAGLTEAAVRAVASGEPAPVVPLYGYGYGPYVHGPLAWGWGFFGIFFWILGFFLIFGLLRAVFGWGRWGRGPRGPNGSGNGWGGGGSRAEEWHRELHRRSGESSGEGDQRPAGA